MWLTEVDATNGSDTTREVTDRILNMISRLLPGHSLQTETFIATRPCPLRKRLHCFHQLLHHRMIYKTDLDTMDVYFRRLLRSVAGPPSQTNWLNAWHEILHSWNARVARYVQEAGVFTWSLRSLQQYWQSCSYIAGLPHAGWVSRFFFLHAFLAWRSGILENVERRSGFCIPPHKFSAVERVYVIGQQRR